MGVDFETGDFSKLPWTTSGDANWSINTTQAHASTYSAQAGPIGDGEQATLEVRLHCGPGEVMFHRKVSSESGFDVFQFAIDGVVQVELSGELDWERESLKVTAGVHNLTFSFSKDSSVSEGADTVPLSCSPRPPSPMANGTE
ncbi:MAG: hypothetical protein H8E73_07210 [Planctomycetes bacterium]|nr:hypothetical protein [Planctomycetota bacterium]MBL7184945.1 hypothetical protein [Phycisphaerae bacterium]